MWSPLGESTLNQTARWQPEPLSRGTFSILSSSLITLSLCLWTAVHLNIPGEGMGSHQKWYKVLWLILGLMAPEVVALCAYKQWSLQRELSHYIRDALGDRAAPEPRKASSWSRLLTALKLTRAEEKDEPIPLESQSQTGPEANRRTHPWTATHGFFAMMGGFAFDVSRGPHVFPLPDGRKRLTLMPKALILLAEAEPDLIPDISAGTIRDKSKANSFAKLLVCVQATWFCLQIITRMAFGLAVSLLELNVFAHALCALVIYLLWWDKPLDIEEPYLIPIPNAEAASVCAALCVGSRLHYVVPTSAYKNGRKVPFRQGPFYRAAAEVLPWKNPAESLRGALLEQAAAEILRKKNPAEGLRWAPPEPAAAAAPTVKPAEPAGPIELRFGERFEDLEATTTTNWIEEPQYSGLSTLLSLPVSFLYAVHDLVSYGMLDGPDPNLRAVVDITPDFLLRWGLARQSATGRRILSEANWKDKFPPVVFDRNRDFVAVRMPNWPLHRSMQCSEAGLSPNLLRYTGLFTAVGCLYGACHLLAWNGPFRTHNEGLLWKLSALGVGLLPACIWAGIRASGPAFKPGSVFTWSIVLPLCAALVTLILFTVFLPFSRVFLVVECFLSLPFVPQSAFALPSWTPYFFHAS